MVKNVSRIGILFVAGYIGSILLANYLILNFPPVQVWPYPALMAPAGVLAAGFAFSFRNAVQQTLGRRFSYVAIVVGALLSYLISPGATVPGGVLPLAWASGIAFLFSETADMIAWSKFREWHWWIRAMFLADLAGQVVDSFLFLALSFGSLEFLAGQVVGKQWTIWPAIGLMKLVQWQAKEKRNLANEGMVFLLRSAVRIAGR